MKISEYRKLLEQIEFEHGDIDCITRTGTFGMLTKPAHPRIKKLYRSDAYRYFDTEGIETNPDKMVNACIL